MNPLQILIFLALFINYNWASHCGHPVEGNQIGGQCQKQPNWKQCTWKNTNDDRDNGQVHECLFYKKSDNSYLRVAYQGNLRVACTYCCKRWYFTFNAKECAIPAPIDALILQHFPSGTPNIHRPGTQEGYCGGIRKGIVRVGFSVGNCHGFGSANAYTSWNSVSRIIIEEVDPPQA
ncbi:hypothetical protein QZH41_011082 [Actinostola sp. cb2023]|nr:hypothetical protein QZH41_011082 [Actinostola sp. cb2023]